MEEMVRRLGKKSAKRETRESNAGDAVGVHDPTRAKAMPRVRPRVTATSYVYYGSLHRLPGWKIDDPRTPTQGGVRLDQESESTAATLLPRGSSTTSERFTFSEFCRTLMSGGTRIRPGTP